MPFLISHKLFCKTNENNEYIGSEYKSFPYYKDGELVKCFDNERFSEDVCRSLRLNGYVFNYVCFPEFGSDDWYQDSHGRWRKGTKRPHYHVLFFFYRDFGFDKLSLDIFNFWGACKDVAFDCIESTDNYGFSTYVSKYVSKGIDKSVYPDNFFADVQRARDLVKKYKDANFDNLPLLTCDQLNSAVKTLHYYETHRPKVLCSNGIGSLKFSDDEIFGR